MDVQIERLDYDDLEGVRRLAELMEACRVHDTPFEHRQSVEMVAADLRYGHDQEPSEHYLARVRGDLVGFGAIYTSTWDNLDVAWVVGQVHPDVRKGGVGTALLEHVHERCLEIGRPSIGSVRPAASASMLVANARTVIGHHPKLGASSATSSFRKTSHIIFRPMPARSANAIQ